MANQFMACCRVIMVVISIVAGPAGLAVAQCGPWGAPVNLSNDTGRYAVDPHTALDASGNLHVVYQSFLDTSGRNYYTTNAGGTWSTRYQLSSMSGKGSAPKIVITPDAQLHAFCGKNTIYWRAKPVSGGTWSEPVVIGYSTGDFIYGAVVDDAGGIYYMWGHLFDSGLDPRNGIWGRYKPLGQPWGPIELIYGNGDDGNWPRGDHLAVKGNTLWVAISVDGKIYFKKKPSGGTWPSGKGTVFNDDGGGLHFAFDSTSSEIAGLWTQDSGCDGPCEDDPWFEVFLKYSHDDGATWTATENVSNYVDDIDRTAYATYDTNGDLHVVWEGFCCSHKLKLRHRARTGGAWGPIENLTPDNPSGVPWDGIKNDGARLLLVYNLTGDGVVGLYDVFLRENQWSAPWINLEPVSFAHAVWIGGNVPADSFTVTNRCTGTLNYTITDNAGWLNAEPATGSSTSDVDTINVNYSVAGLPAGVYQATITVSGNAGNSPQTIPVTVTVNTVGPDFDGDADVDQTDFGAFQICLSGAFIPYEPGCEWANLDSDVDVDNDDVVAFVGCMSGADVPANPACVP